MAKLKTHSGAKKRFRKNGSGNFKCGSAYKSHILTKKSTKRKRQLRAPSLIAQSDKKAVIQMLPYA